MSGAECERMRLLVQADLDGELDAAGAAAAAAHQANCIACAREQAEFAALSRRLRFEAPRHTAPPALQRALSAAAGARPLPWLGWLRRNTSGIGLGLAAGVALTIMVARPLGGRDTGAGLVDSHIRALQPGHLLDVISTDRHTVKPWFDGKLDFAPPVRDFASQGFPLKGARLDYWHRAAAVLVYGRDRHLIDVYVWPEAAEQADEAGSFKGYNIVFWHQAGMAFRAVSDLNQAELQDFRALWTQP